jgi:thiamine transport system ATP-binding protein
MPVEANTPAIILEHAGFAWPGMPMKFNLKVARNQITIVTGPSGSGKSTLLNLIAGFEKVAGGQIIIDNTDCTDAPISRRPVSFLFQEHNLFGHLSVETNAGFGISPSRAFSKADQQRIRGALADVGLAGKESRLPHQLSGGERQRAAFARVLLENRPVLLLDEPFASLGPSLRLEMMELLQGMQKAHPRTILAVTHHPREWARVAGSFVFVDGGRIAAHGRLSDLEGPALADQRRAVRFRHHDDLRRGREGEQTGF